MDILYFAAVLSAAVATLCLVPLSIQLAKALGMLDQPDARKVHTQPTPRLGGIGIAGGILLSGVGCSLYLWQTDQLLPPGLGLQLLAVAVATTFIFIVGLIDDIRGVSSIYKLLALIAASMMVCGSGATLVGLRAEWGFMVEFLWLDWLLTMLWIAGIAVSMNFIDGLDGLAGGIALICSVVLAAFLIAGGQTAAAIIPLAMSGALAGFLYYNWHPAKTFMGDGGSMLLGFLLATSMVIANPLVGSMRGIVIPALGLSVAITDAVLTMIRRRYQQRRSIFSAERGHIHHRLLARGMTHPQAVTTIYIVSIVAVFIGVVSLQFTGIATLGGLALVIPLLWGTFRMAGSIKTGEILNDIRRKRAMDRESKQYRNNFETLQLEFAHVDNFAGWWQGLCRAADRLDFVSVHIPVPCRDGSTYNLDWKTTNQDLTEQQLGDFVCMTATVPIADRRSGNGPLQATVVIAACGRLESAGQRLALFTRLMEEYSLRSLLEKETTTSNSKTSLLPENAEDLVKRREQCGPFGHLRIALVHDAFIVEAGAEKVVGQFIEMFPHCDLYALVDFLPEDQRDFLKGKPVHTTFIQGLPFAKKNHGRYLPLMPLAIEQLNLSQYDLVISSSSLAAKGVLTGPDQLHVCYCHSPVRYAWDQQHDHLESSKLGYGLLGMLTRTILHYIRNWDTRSSFGVDQFIANSRFVAQRISKTYRRESTVVHAPVDIDFFVPSAEERGDFYLAVSYMAPYKRTNLLVEAFNQIPHRKLKLVGNGPEIENLRKIAGPNIEFLGRVEHARLRKLFQHAKALVFAAEEDFGIVPIEAMACATPVIAFGKGGVTDSVKPGLHGILFEQQTVESLLEAVNTFEQSDFNDDEARAQIRRQAERFSNEYFRNRLTGLIGQWVVQKWPEQAAKLSESESESTEACSNDLLQRTDNGSCTVKAPVSALPRGQEDSLDIGL